MALPPLSLGAVKLMLALALPAVATPMVGAPGTVVVVVPLLPPPQALKAMAASKAGANKRSGRW